MKHVRNGSSRYFFYLLFGLLIIFGIYSGIKAIITKWDLFTVKEIEIVGNENLETEFLRNLSQDCLNKNLYALTKAEIFQKYENIPRMKKIKISRILPDKLKIKIEEKVAKFYIRSKEGEICPISKEREILDNNFSYAEDLPIITTDISAKYLKIGAKIDNPFVKKIFELEKIIRTHDEIFADQISEYVIKNNTLNLINANNGHRIIFGEDEEICYQLQKYRKIEDNRPYHTGQIIDLRFSDKLVIKTEDQ